QLPSWHNPPPIRREGAEEAPDITVPDDGGHVDVFEADTPLAEFEGALTAPTPVRAARRSLLIAFILLVVGAGVLGVIIVSVLNKLTKKEEELARVARQDYADGKYADAANAFENSIKEFPKSDQLPRYRLYAELS